MTVSGSWERAARGAMLLGNDGDVKQTIFAEMSGLATRTGAINLGQGFPDEDGPREVLEAARQAISDGFNQYPPGIGMPVLRHAIADHQKRFYGITVDPDREVLVTAGATEALTATILALTDEGDEVVTLEPFYDSYAAIIGLNKATHVRVPLRAPSFQPDPDELAPGRHRPHPAHPDQRPAQPHRHRVAARDPRTHRRARRTSTTRSS